MIYILACVLFVGYMASDGWAGAFYAFIFGTGIIAALLMRRWRRKQDELLNCSLTGRSLLHPQDASYVSPEVRIYLEERALIVASLLARGGSEIYLQCNEPESGLQIVTRQTENAFLREHGLWAKLEQAEVDLVSAADGRWTVEQQNHVVAWCEQLRLLRWVLGVDADLAPLEHFPRLDFSLSLELLQRQNAGASGKPVLNAWEVRGQRDIALEYAARVVAELKARGFVPDGPELEGWADEFRARSLGASSDYLAGAKTVAELNDDALRLLGSLAAARESYASYLMDQLNALQALPYSAWEHNRTQSA